MSGQLILSATLSTRSKRLDLGGRTSVCTLFPYCKFCCPGGPKLESLHAQSHISTGDSVRCSCKHFNKWSGICAAVLQRGATKSWPRRQRFRISGIPKHTKASLPSSRYAAGDCLLEHACNARTNNALHLLMVKHLKEHCNFLIF